MKNPNRLLTIGEISKYTGAGIKALRYYEKINVLKPAFVDPETGYRYYSFDQTYLIELIRFCIELDIPLKELRQYIDADETIDFKSFLKHGKSQAHKKMRALSKGLRFIGFFEEMMELQEMHCVGAIYTREIPERRYCAIPNKVPFDDADPYEVTKLLLEMPFVKENEDNLLEYGYIIEQHPGGIHRYVAAELPDERDAEDCIVMPGGRYHCIQLKGSKIEHVRQIFADYLKDKTSYIAIETDLIAGSFNIHEPLTELRVI
jgi:DNA-binding transcriptional MerR regulator